MMEIRAFEPLDFEAVVELHQLGMTQTGADRGPGPWDDDLSTPDAIITTYVEAGGVFAVGMVRDRIVAMGALKPTGDGWAEIKRMRVHPGEQRRGYGQGILDHLESSAIERNARVLFLDTTTLQDAAIGLYSKNGYTEVSREALDGFVVLTFEKRLDMEVGHGP